MKIITVPNLDGLSREEVFEFWRRCYLGRLSFARELFPTRPQGYTRAAKDLARYAADKTKAMHFRELGQVSDALRYERRCDRIYNALPPFAKW